MIRGYGDKYIKLSTELHPKRKDIHAKSPKVVFRLLRDKKTGKIYYRKFHVIDARWYKKEWQKKASPKINKLISTIAVALIFMKVSRRQGKTFWAIHYSNDVAFEMKHDNPIINFYCLLATQGLRNAKLAMEHMMIPLPGAYFDNKENTLVIHRPTLKNPSNTIILELKGVRGGSESKVGNRADISIGDEFDGFTKKFFNKNLIVPATDNNGICIGIGTDFDNEDIGLGTLDFYISKAKRMVGIKEKIKSGLFVPNPPKSYNNWSYYEADATQTKVYSKT